MASFPNPLARSLRLAEAFEAGRKGVPRSKFFTPVITKELPLRWPLKLDLPSARAMAMARRSKARNAGAPALEDFVGQVGKIFKKPVVQLELPGIEQYARRYSLPHRAAENARSASKQAAIQKFPAAFPRLSESISRFHKGRFRWGRNPVSGEYGITRADIRSMPYKVGRLLRRDYPLKHKIAGLIPGTKWVRGSDLRSTLGPVLSRRTLFRPTRMAWRTTKAAAKSAAQKGATELKNLAQGTVGKINAAMSQKLTYPAKIRTKFSTEHSVFTPRESDTAYNFAHVDVTAGHSPLAKFDVESTNYGRKLRLRQGQTIGQTGQRVGIFGTQEEQLGVIHGPVTQTGNFSIRSNARMAERVRNIRQVVHHLRQKYPGTHEWEVQGPRYFARLGTKNPAKPLRYTRPDRPHQ